jgi:hypothetical protein
MSEAFTRAAASYYGMNPEQLDGTNMSVDGAGLVLIFHVRPSDDDLIGIIRRMQQMRESQPEPRPDDLPVVTYEEVARNSQMWADAGVEAAKVKVITALSEEYSNMDPATRGKYGSRRNYVIAKAQELDAQLLISGGYGEDAKHVIDALAGVGRQVKHVDAPQDSQAEQPQVVWLDHTQASAEQLRFSSDQKMIGERVHYAVNVQMLTPEQRAELGL